MNAGIFYNEPWCLERGVLEQLAQVKAAAGAPPRQKPMRYMIENDTAIVPIRGVLTDSAPGWLRAFIAITSYSDIRAAVTQADADSTVSRILLDVDSPGGFTRGCIETAAAIRGVNKPVDAYVRGMAASAAYWLASQAQTITAGPVSQIGSIGTFAVLHDESAAAEAAGVKVHVVSSGPLKGMGEPGTAITPEQLQSVQAIVDGITDLFVADVARGRKRPENAVREWATGAVWLASTAETMGLIDKVQMQPTAAATATPARAKASTKDDDDDHIEYLHHERLQHAGGMPRMPGAATPPPAPPARDFHEEALYRARLQGTSYTEAARALAAEQPELHAAYTGRRSRV